MAELGITSKVVAKKSVEGSKTSKTVDANGDGEISKNEFEKYSKTKLPLVTPEERAKLLNDLTEKTGGKNSIKLDKLERLIQGGIKLPPAPGAGGNGSQQNPSSSEERRPMFRNPEFDLRNKREWFDMPKGDIPGKEPTGQFLADLSSRVNDSLRKHPASDRVLNDLFSKKKGSNDLGLPKKNSDTK